MNTHRGSTAFGAALGSVLLLALGVDAKAADIYDYDSGMKGGYEVPPPPPPSDRGIYIKGYLGQANPSVGDFTNERIEAGGFTKVHKDLKSSPLYGIGVGWRARHWLRFDGTFEYRGNAVLIAHDRYTGGGGGTNEYTADVKGWLGLANVYWDIYNWCGITPYVGAGIGWATLSVNGLRDDNIPNLGVAYGADKTQTNFAWALYAGTSIEVSPQVALDLSYRYVNMGDMSSGRVTSYDGLDTYSGMHFKDITSNDFLLGVRYKFDSPAPVAYAVK